MRAKLLYKNSLAVAATALAFLLAATSALAQTSSFTYQGRLTDGGAAANGNYDLQFAVFDSLSGGTQIGSTQTLNTVAVSNGVFTVTLDFGANSFPGANRFLEISARLSGAGSFTLLTPRQPITATPYAVRSANASSADGLSGSCNGCVTDTNITGVAGSKITGTIPVNAVPAGSGNYIQNTNSTQSGSFNISGNGTAGGTLSGNVVNSTTQYNIGGNRVLSISGNSNNNVFAGVGAGQSEAGSSGNAFFGFQAGFNNTTGTFNSFFGDSAGAHNPAASEDSFFGDAAGVATTGSRNSFFGTAAGNSYTAGDLNSFLGYRAGFSGSGDNNTLLGAGTTATSGVNNGTAIGANAQVAQSNSLVLGSVSGITAGPNTNVGIGTTAPLSRLDIRGDLFLGLTGQPASPNPVNTSNSLFIGNDGGDANVSLRLDGFQNNLFIVARSGSGAAAGAGIIFRTATAGGGEADVVTINPSGTLSVPRFGSNGTATVCRNLASELAFCNSSSLRYKKNVATFAGGMNIINRLRPISFTWKQDGTKDIGFGAEEVEKVAPLFTFRNDKGEIEGVRYDRLGVVFVNAFKEQQAQIQKQQEQLARAQTLATQQQQQILRQQEQMTRAQAVAQRQQQQLDALQKLVCRSHRRAPACK